MWVSVTSAVVITILQRVVPKAKFVQSAQENIEQLNVNHVTISVLIVCSQINISRQEEKWITWQTTQSTAVLSDKPWNEEED